MRYEYDLKSIPDDELLRSLTAIVRRTNHVEAELVAHIAEVDERRLFTREAAPSMHAYCTEVLHLAEPVAWLRIRVARASRKHPALLGMLRGGRIHLTGIALLAPHLTPKNRDALLKRATHKTKRQIEEIVAELEPRPDVTAGMRKLPSPRVAPACPPDPGPNPHAPTARLRPDTVGLDTASPGLRPDAAGQVTGKQVAGSLELRPDAAVGGRQARSRPATIEPLAPARYRVEFTAGQELHDKLERLRALMRSSVPDGDLGAIIDVAVTRELERLEARRFAKTKAPRKGLSESDTTPRSRYIPAAVRRAVEKRDGSRCTYRDTHGRRCTQRHDLEFHHRVPFGYGGQHAPRNLALVCAPHNRLLAEQDYGKEVIERQRRTRRQAESRSGRHPGFLGTGAGAVPD